MLKIYLCSLFSLAGNLAEGLHNDNARFVNVVSNT